mmetsp:Transcript_1230/g.3283  ORF Transcript_1230/g.3283 Transcript_1230/m.3283 type:complete len:270 (-) Transcript_1230:757-1566(-)
MLSSNYVLRGKVKRHLLPASTTIQPVIVVREGMPSLVRSREGPLSPRLGNDVVDHFLGDVTRLALGSSSLPGGIRGGGFAAQLVSFFTRGMEAVIGKIVALGASCPHYSFLPPIELLLLLLLFLLPLLLQHFTLPLPAPLNRWLGHSPGLSILLLLSQLRLERFGLGLGQLGGAFHGFSLSPHFPSRRLSRVTEGFGHAFRTRECTLGVQEGGLSDAQSSEEVSCSRLCFDGRGVHIHFFRIGFGVAPSLTLSKSPNPSGPLLVPLQSP